MHLVLFLSYSLIRSFIPIPRQSCAHWHKGKGAVSEIWTGINSVCVCRGKLWCSATQQASITAEAIAWGTTSPQKNRRGSWNIFIVSEFVYALCSIVPQSGRAEGTGCSSLKLGQTEGGCWEFLQPQCLHREPQPWDFWQADEVIYVKVWTVTQHKWSCRCNDVLNQNKLVQNLNQ